MLQKCYKCGDKKDLSEFHKNKRKVKGVTDICKECRADHDKQYWLQNKEKLREKRKEYRLNNKEKLRQKKKEYYKNNKEKVNERNRQNHIKNKNYCIYGLYLKETDDYYVGETVNFTARVRNHKSDLKRKKHVNERLQKYYDSYGWENIEPILLEKGLVSKLERLKAEIKWIEMGLENFNSVVNDCV